MKQILSVLIAGVVLMAAILIPLDAKRSDQAEIYNPAESGAALEAGESGTEATVSGDGGAQQITAEETSVEEEEPHSDANTPAETVQETRGAQQKQASTKATQPQTATPSQPSASSPQATKPATTERATSGVRLPTRPVQQSTQPTTRPAATNPETNGSGSNQSYMERIVELVNQERAREGLSPLTVNKSAEAAALVRARETETSFSHTRPNGSSFSTALTEQGVSYRTAGENIAWGQKTPEQVMQGWMNSPGHRANIMSSKFTSIGVGYYRSASGTNYWTQLFIG